MGHQSYVDNAAVLATQALCGRLSRSLNPRVAHRRLTVGNREYKREGVYRLAALGVSSLVPDQSRPALMDLVWERPAVVAASLISLGSM